ncbi:MAG: hypothetical protein EXS13_13155 [Planctomycetes bacterium]|nr:hypothetical protein [Planctomycetota bacterium]
MTALPLLSTLLATDFDWTFLIQGLTRWAHILSGITWIGLLYFFNLINMPTQGKLDGPTKKAVNPELLPRALWWFRWGAMSTVVFGLLSFYFVYIKGPYMREGGAEGPLSARALWIMIGMTLGLVMWFNVWFVIWPTQRTIIRATKEGQKPPEGAPERAKLFSRINFVLSGPMLLAMVAPSTGIGTDALSMAIGFGVSLVVIHLMLRASTKAGTSI